MIIIIWVAGSIILISKTGIFQAQNGKKTIQNFKIDKDKNFFIKFFDFIFFNIKNSILQWSESEFLIS